MIKNRILFLVIRSNIEATNSDRTIMNIFIFFGGMYSFLYFMIINEINNTVDMNSEDCQERDISKDIGYGVQKDSDRDIKMFCEYRNNDVLMISEVIKIIVFIG